MLSTERIVAALEDSNLASLHRHASLGELVDYANRELERWGHGDHEVTLEQVRPFFGDPEVLNCSFWCETCHVSQVVLLSPPDRESEPTGLTLQLNG